MDLSSTFEIPGRLEGMNRYTNIQRSHWALGAKLKREQQRKVEECIIAAQVRKFTCPVEIAICWIEGHKKNGAVRDIDNITAGGTKIILDALVACEIIPDDSPRYVRHIFNQFKFNETNPRIQVEIMRAAPEGRSVFFAPVTGIKEP